MLRVSSKNDAALLQGLTLIPGSPALSDDQYFINSSSASIFFQDLSDALYISSGVEKQQGTQLVLIFLP